jgi:hypothetical protein
VALIRDIRRKRAKGKQKQPFRQDEFNRVNSIVKQYGLDDTFLSIIDEGRNSEIRSFQPPQVRAKVPISSLFALATREEYSITMAIMEKITSPYLKFAQSPEEILICDRLYRLNPSIPPKKLMRFHFETLLLHESARTDRKKLDRQAANSDDSPQE